METVLFNMLVELVTRMARSKLFWLILLTGFLLWKLASLIA